MKNYVKSHTFKKIPLSPLVLIMTRQISLSPLVKTMKNLIVTTSGDNEIIITTSGDNMLNTLKTIVLLIWQCYCCLIHLWTMKLSHSCTRNVIFHLCLRHSWNITLLVHSWDNFHCPLLYQTTILHYTNEMFKNQIILYSCTQLYDMLDQISCGCE